MEGDVSENVMKVNDEVIVVVFKKENETIIVITAYTSFRVLAG